MTKWIFFMVMPLFLGGCAALPALTPALLPSGSVNADLYTGTAVKLEQANFVTLKTNVVGMDKGFALFGIITLVPARFSLAMDKLYGQAEMRTGRPQTLANVVAAMEPDQIRAVTAEVDRIAKAGAAKVRYPKEQVLERR